MEIITSRSNPKIKETRLLRQHKARQERGVFLVEGIRHVGEAADAAKAGKAQIEALFYAPEQLTSEFAKNLIEELRVQGIPCHATSREVFDSLADKENPQGILAVVRQAAPALQSLSPQNFPWGVALVAPQDPGNLGSILRTVDAVGASGVLLLDSSLDPYQPNAVRASMGALFWYPPASATFAEFAAWASQHLYTVYGTSASGSVDYREVEQYTRPAILVMGSEREGLSEEQRLACDQLIRLPMLGRASSLNLAVATGVLLYEMLARAGS